jgi:hypothetical protein
MLERVMRRFGVSPHSSARESTYFESLLDRARERVTERLASDSATNPVVLVARECVRLEAEIDERAALDAGRLSEDEGLLDYLWLLRDNDRLPPAGQLNGRELRLARPLLFRENSDPQWAGRAYDAVLGLLEDKFSSGFFTQAGLLLRLFETTPARHRSNERTLFYEEMLSRFGSPRAGRLPANQVRRYTKAFAAGEHPGDQLLGAARWLNQQARVRLDILMRPQLEIDTWESALAAAERNRREATMVVLPHARWRPVEEIDEVSLVDAIRRHLDLGGLVEYLDRLLKACYFVVVVTSRTGFEPFIKRYFEWVAHNFGFPGTRLLPQLHRMTTLEERSLHEALMTIREDFFEPHLATVIARIDDGAVERAVGELAEVLRGIDPNDIPAGDYDLTALVLDRLTGLQVDVPTVLFRVHRLC